jgi:glycerophosphoryl diester phosphodiesterase
VDLAQKLYDTLSKYGIESIDKSNSKLPIIVECFEAESLRKFAALSDLPLIQLMFPISQNVSYNLSEITQYTHGVGPSQDWLFLYKNETWNQTNESKFV